jgi:hypothetical protein
MFPQRHFLSRGERVASIFSDWVKKSLHRIGRRPVLPAMVTPLQMAARMMIIHWQTILTIPLYNCLAKNQAVKFAGIRKRGKSIAP